MLFNNLNDDGNSVAQIEWPKTCSSVDKVANNHTLEKRPFLLENGMTKQRIWEPFKNFYQRTFYSSFWKKVPMCLECYKKHVI